MAMTLTITIRCEMCGREESQDVRESWRSGRYEIDAPTAAQLFPRWKLLGPDGYEVRDFRDAKGRTLCEGCTNVFRDKLKRQREEMDALFEG